MVLMNGPKRVRSIQSTTNKITIYGDMGGLIPTANRRVANDAARRNKGANNINIPVPGLGAPAANTFGAVPTGASSTGIAYMMGQNPTGRYMLSRNPSCSGGVGRKPVNICNSGLRW
tara:strand:+ start:1008 stop:1358 length:351 start_codon:yes stop_codon:yes gene_type:complete